MQLPKYITYRNKRVIPTMYKNMREERMNRTMDNIRNKRLGISRNKPNQQLPSSTEKTQPTFAATNWPSFASKTMDRSRRAQDTFLTVLPGYGVVPDDFGSEN